MTLDLAKDSYMYMTPKSCTTKEKTAYIKKVNTNFKKKEIRLH